MTIAEYTRMAVEAENRIYEIAEYVVSDPEFRDAMLNMERSRLKEGERADGTVIEPPYTLFTIMVKERKGQPTDRVTLFDTGDFYGAFTAEASGDTLFLSSSDWKTEKLERKYGEAIFGLTEEDKEKLRAMSVAIIRRWFNENNLI